MSTDYTALTPEQAKAAKARRAAGRFAHRERLAIAEDLGLDTSAGSEAETIALREARRAAAGVPPSLTASREPDLIDHALAAFECLGGLTYVQNDDESDASAR